MLRARKYSYDVAIIMHQLFSPKLIENLKIRNLFYRGIPELNVLNVIFAEVLFTFCSCFPNVFLWINILFLVNYYYCYDSINKIVVTGQHMTFNRLSDRRFSHPMRLITCEFIIYFYASLFNQFLYYGIFYSKYQSYNLEIRINKNECVLWLCIFYNQVHFPDTSIFKYPIKDFLLTDL